MPWRVNRQQSSRTSLHTHMGGSVLMSVHSDRKAAAHIAKAADARSLVLNFRRSPKHKHPAQVDDVADAFHWLLEHGYQCPKIASVGHSIGGYPRWRWRCATAASRARSDSVDLAMGRCHAVRCIDRGQRPPGQAAHPRSITPSPSYWHPTQLPCLRERRRREMRSCSGGSMKVSTHSSRAPAASRSRPGHRRNG